MHLERYEYKTDDSHDNFEFESVCQDKIVRKIIEFVPRNSGGITYFNLSFGDWDEERGIVNHFSFTNNKDTQKILATVGAAVLDFTEHFPDMSVYMQGSTAARTRLYQIGICIHWDEIEPLLTVYGYRDNEWHSFEKNVNYEAFLAIRK